MRIDYLADHPRWIPIVNDWYFREWSHLHPDSLKEEWLQRLIMRCQRDRIPSAFVGSVDGVPVGGAALVAHDLPARPDLTPWLSGVYVDAPWRHRACGRALVARVEEAACALGVAKLHLFTPDRMEFYAAMGWSALSVEGYAGLEVTVMEKRLAGMTDPASDT